MVSKIQYTLWLQTKYSNLPELKSFKKAVESEFEEIKSFFSNNHSETSRLAYFKELRHYYLELANKKSSQEDKIKKNGLITAMIIFIIILFYFSFMRGSDPSIGFIFFFGMLAWIAVVYWFLRVKNKRSTIAATNKGYELIKKARNNGVFRPLKENEFPEIIEEILLLASKMNIKVDKSNLYFDPRVKSSPAISELQSTGKKEILVTLTRNSILMYKKNLAAFKAIYTHEFGHILQMDTKLWISKLIPLEVYIPMIKSEVGIEANEDYELDYSILDQDYDIDDAIGQIDIPGLSLLLRPYIKKRQIEGQKNIQTGRRHESEFLADLCSVAYTESLEIMNVLMDSFNQEVNDQNHPTTELRIVSLKYQLLCAHYRFEK